MQISIKFWTLKNIKGGWANATEEPNFNVQEEQEGEVIDRRNTEEISLFFPHPSFPLLRPIQLRDVISCQVIIRHTLGLVTEDEKDWQSVRPLLLLSEPIPLVYLNRKWAHIVPYPVTLC